MTCAVTRELEAGVEQFTLRDGDARATVVPAWGANCVAWHDRLPVLEPVAAAELARKPTSYGIPILMPYPNRIRDGAFTFDGARYTVSPNRHGYVRDRPWRVAGHGADAATGAWITCELDAGDHPDAILAQFPFRFRARVTYRLRGGTLLMETAVANLGERRMPLGFGTHPYFRRPARGTLLVPANRRWALDDALPTGELVDVAGDLDLRRPRDVASLSLDDIYTDLIADADGRVRCVLDDHEHQVRTVVEVEAARFPHIVVYTAPAPRQAICIEPYTCPTDAFNLQARGVDAGVIALEPGGEVELRIWTRAESYGSASR